MSHELQAWERIEKSVRWLLQLTEKLAIWFLPETASHQSSYIEGIVAEWMYIRKQNRTQGISELKSFFLGIDVLKGVFQLLIDSYFEAIRLFATTRK